MLLRVPLRRERGELVDVSEDRLGEQRQGAAVHLGLDRERGYAPPRDSRPEPVCRQERVERAPLAMLAAPESAIDALGATAIEGRAGDQVGELAQGLFDAGANPGAEAALERSSVGGHADADRLDHLVAERRQLRPQEVGDPRGDPLPGIARRAVLVRRSQNPILDCCFRGKKRGSDRRTVISEMPPVQRYINLAAVVLPFLAFVAALVLLWNRAVGWTDLAILAAMYLVTAFGITIGYHRLLTHRAFQTYKPVEYALAVAGSMAVQGPVIDWVADHRKHHAHTDEDGDPHSPHVGHGSGLAGLWHAHVGWLFDANGQASRRKYAPDLIEDRRDAAINRRFPWLVGLSLLLPFAPGC